MRGVLMERVLLFAGNKMESGGPMKSGFSVEAKWFCAFPPAAPALLEDGQGLGVRPACLGRGKRIPTLVREMSVNSQL
jgi:hypothetical protein